MGVSYEYLFDTLRRERSREEIQELDQDFYASSEIYVKSKSEEVKALDPLSEEGEHERIQLQNARKLLKELYDRREKKIMMLALNKARTGSNIIDTSALLPSESQLFEQMVSLLQAVRSAKNVVPTPESTPQETPIKPEEPSQPVEASPSEEVVLEEKKPVETETNVPGDVVQVKITNSTPKFMGGSNQTFGPFNEGDLVEVPEKIGQILVKKGRAEQV